MYPVKGAVTITWFDYPEGDLRREWFGGEKKENFPMDVNVCYKFGHWNDRISAIDTQDNCVVVYEGIDCNGKEMRVDPHVGCYKNFADCDFDNIASSIKLC
jgi:hypothetical protein